jgi:hypothetical protein
VSSILSVVFMDGNPCTIHGDMAMPAISSGNTAGLGPLISRCLNQEHTLRKTGAARLVRLFL